MTEPLVNLLPWRHRRSQKQRLRLIFFALAMLALAIVIPMSGRHALRAEKPVLEHWIHSDKHILNAISEKLSREKLEHQQLLVRQNEMWRRQQRAWRVWDLERGLAQVIELLPAQIWLTRINLTGLDMTVSGVAPGSLQIADWEQRLRRVWDGQVALQHLSHDESGRNRFRIALTREVHDALLE
ncbi:hypothetical protein TUM12370_03250 [Salmonella enterica subsp. enterica serovar Choleraesuis]|nr:hypothetical protein TUM12370_03250 [Salmonella enterica subsp. enterica serovar Choleraesuis]